MKNNKLECLALFIGMQYTSKGWYDNEYQLRLPYITDTVFDELLFHKSWDWLSPVIRRVWEIGLDDVNEFYLFDGTHEDEVYGLEDALWKGDIEVAFEHTYQLVSLIIGDTNEDTKEDDPASNLAQVLMELMEAEGGEPMFDDERSVHVWNKATKILELYGYNANQQQLK